MNANIERYNMYLKEAENENYGFFQRLRFCYLGWRSLRKAKYQLRQLKRITEFKTEEKRSRYISKSVQREVWRRDQGKCVDCDSKVNIEYDHIIPFSEGGSNTARNIQLLCESCNRSKGATI